MQDYIKAALTTKSDDFHGKLVGYFYFVQALRDFVDAARHLDAIKKTLFYGRKLYKIETNHNWGVDLAQLPTAIHPDIIHAIVGIATEAGEMVEALLKAIEDIAHGRASALDEVNLKEESGDILWYFAILFHRIGTTFGVEARRNIAKLMLRFPDGFTDENALVRDLIAERNLLERDAA
jgi:NTP pyrophosphatase (non-canonical NTP hydrolase)